MPVGDPTMFAPNVFRSGRITVATPGTRVQLPSNDAVGVTVRALSTNVGLIYVGGPDVDTTNGFGLSPGDSLSLELADTEYVYVDADTAGDGAGFIWVAP